MKKTFPTYYLGTERGEELVDLWDNCLFVLDANVLLNLYDLSPQSADDLIETLTKIAEWDRLWVPYQVYHEYRRERPRKIAEVSSRLYDRSLAKLRERLLGTKTELGELRKDGRLPPAVDPLFERIKATFDEISKELENGKQRHLDSLNADPIKDKIDELLEGRIGPEYSEEQSEEIYEQGEKRYRSEIPPGFEDARPKSDNVRQYGDLVLWFQIIDHAKATGKPIILVTDDTKQDWWLKVTRKGEAICPRPELTEEMREKAGVQFYMYETDSFSEHAPRYLDLSVSQEVIEEVQELKEQRELDMDRARLMQLYLKDPYFGVRQSSEQAEETLRRMAEAPRRIAEAFDREMMEQTRERIRQMDEAPRRMAEVFDREMRVRMEEWRRQREEIQQVTKQRPDLLSDASEDAHPDSESEESPEEEPDESNAQPDTED